MSYQAFVTNIGVQLLAYHQANGTHLPIEGIALYSKDLSAMTESQMRELEASDFDPADFCEYITDVTIGRGTTDQVLVTIFLDSTHGDYTIRSAVLFASTNEPIAVGRVAETQKLKTSEAQQGDNLQITFELTYSNVADIAGVVAPAEAFQYDQTPEILQIKAETKQFRDEAQGFRDDAQALNDGWLEDGGLRDQLEALKLDAEAAKTGAEQAKTDTQALSNSWLEEDGLKDQVEQFKLDAEAAKTAAINAKTAAGSASSTALEANLNAIQAKNDAVTAKNGAETAKNDAVAAKDAIINGKYWTYVGEYHQGSHDIAWTSYYPAHFEFLALGQRLSAPFVQRINLYNTGHGDFITITDQGGNPGGSQFRFEPSNDTLWYDVDVDCSVKIYQHENKF